MELSEKQGFTLVHTFDDDEIIAGQGTIGLEILEQLPDVEAIVCPVGGGGLIAGIAAAVKETNPNVAIYGVEASACPSMAQSLREKKPIPFLPCQRWLMESQLKSQEFGTLKLLKNMSMGLLPLMS